MKRIAVLLILITGISGLSLRGQETPARKAEKPTRQMTLRVNTRDRVMTCRANTMRFRIQRRESMAIDKSRTMQQRRMMLHEQRRTGQQQMQRQFQRRATERQMMQQNQQMRQQRPGGTGFRH